MADRTRDWTLEDIAWHEFDGAQVDPDLLKIAKASALVEFNGGEYARYLTEVFDDDPAFCAAARKWGAEEMRHGAALRAWAERVDPDFDFDQCFERFARTIRLPTGCDKSVRGSRSGELVSRCMVEVGTSSFYSALADASNEPVFRDICRRIAADEVRHYKLFYSALRRYQAIEGIGPLRRLWVAVTRMGEMRDDELPFAYFAANAPSDRFGELTYDRRASASAYAGKAFSYYRPGHVRRAIIMIFKALGLATPNLLVTWLTGSVCRILNWRLRRIADSDTTARGLA